MLPRLPRPPRDRQRGNSLLLALIVMSALATLGSLTVVSVQSSLKTSTNERAATIAMYAAESGAAVAMDYLRTLLPVPGPPLDAPPGAPRIGLWNAQLSAAAPGTPLAFAGNGAPPGGNPLALELNASYTVVLFNNRETPASPLADTDGRYILRSTGSGPQGSVVILEWEIEMRTDSTAFVLRGFHIAL